MTLLPTWICRVGAAGVMLSLAACGGGGPTEGPAAVKPNPVPTAPTTNCSAAGVAASNASTATATVCMLTSNGEIVVELYGQAAPATVTNFLRYVQDGFYSNTLFHRVPRDFVVQGGGFTPGGVAKTPTYAAIALESNNGLSNQRGTLAMARTSTPNSATSQFYFNSVNNTALNYNAAVSGANGYAVFGKVISGQATLDAINAEPRWAFNAETPATEVLLYWAQRLK
jgi:cyclophilin family peptidyl-prolyl cis-trans isomerase